MLEDVEEANRVREKEDRDHDRQARQISLDDVRPTLGGGGEAHAAEARVTSRMHQDQGNQRDRQKNLHDCERCDHGLVD